MPPLRFTVTVPLSSGERSASRVAASNCGASSRNSTPWCAKEIAPGAAMPDPPPTIDGSVAEWCGASNGA